MLCAEEMVTIFEQEHGFILCFLQYTVVFLCCFSLLFFFAFSLFSCAFRLCYNMMLCKKVMKRVLIEYSLYRFLTLMLVMEILSSDDIFFIRSAFQFSSINGPY